MYFCTLFSYISLRLGKPDFSLHYLFEKKIIDKNSKVFYNKKVNKNGKWRANAKIYDCEDGMSGIPIFFIRHNNLTKITLLR